MNTSTSVPAHSVCGFDFSYPEYVPPPPVHFNMDSKLTMNMVPYSPSTTSTLPPAPSLWQPIYSNDTTDYSSYHQYSTLYSTKTTLIAPSASDYWTETQLPPSSLPTTATLVPSVSKPTEIAKPTKARTAPTHRCSNCNATESCQWRNVRSKDFILCNPCFVYKKKYKTDRSTKVAKTYQARKMKEVNSE